LIIAYEVLSHGCDNLFMPGLILDTIC
jgi:hypothetical protein